LAAALICSCYFVTFEGSIETNKLLSLDERIDSQRWAVSTNMHSDDMKTTYRELVSERYKLGIYFGEEEETKMIYSLVQIELRLSGI
jgi:hypothetical protein